MPTPEPEFLDAAGIARKAHYGTGTQPWDLILAAAWGASFAAGNVLKYLRRAAAKNGEDDITRPAGISPGSWRWFTVMTRGLPMPHGICTCC